MYLTILNNLLELVLDIGSRGFTFILYVNSFCVASIDSSYREIAILIIAIMILKGELLWSIIRYMSSFVVRCCSHLQSILSHYLNS